LLGSDKILEVNDASPSEIPDSHASFKEGNIVLFI
jgi:hypothetical protein